MDPFSATASAIAVIQIAEEVWTLLQNYTLAVKDARKDIQRLSAEVLALHGILERVEDLKNQPGSAQLKTLDLLANLGGPIAQCLGDLKDLASKLRPGHGPTAMNRAGWRALKWPFTSKDIDKKILFLERYKTTFTLALSTDNTTTLINIALKTIHIEKEVTQIDNGVEQLKQAITVSRTNDETVQALDRRNMIIDWLKTTDPSINHYAAMKKYQAGTGKWFVKGPYMGSLKKQNSLLWLYGIPGCGKTILSSTIIESINEYCNSNPGNVLAYYYFSFNDNRKQTAYNFLSSILGQICHPLFNLLQELIELYSD